MMRRALLPLVAALVLPGLSGCDLLGIEGAAVVAERKAAEGKAIGAACRHAGRAIEDCYQLNKKADKAAVYAGWREMDDYMRENKLEPVVPQLAGKPKAPEGDEDAEDESASKADTKAAAKDEPKHARTPAKKGEAH
jgi:hypothetical protein